MAVTYDKVQMTDPGALKMRVTMSSSLYMYQEGNHCK